METTCAICGAAFTPTRIGVGGGRPQRYCGRTCRNISHRHPAAPLSVEDRFWRHVDRSGGPDACWAWLGATVGQGYGLFGVGGSPAKGGFQTTSQRVALALKEGRPLADLRDERRYALHACDTPACCNPAHLFWGTQRENLADMRAKGRRKRTGPPGGQLDDDAVRAIRSQYAAGGISQTALAAEYGVNQTTISRVVLRQIWEHVP